MVQSAKDANVVVLRRQNGRVVIDNNPPNVEKWRVDQILTSALFGLPSARALELDAALEERDAILGQAELTPDDEARLAALSEVIGAVPYGDTPEDIVDLRPSLARRNPRPLRRARRLPAFFRARRGRPSGASA